jgi:hypothetical protein
VRINTTFIFVDLELAFPVLQPGWLAGGFLGTIFVPTHILQTPKFQKLTACGF